MRPRHGRRTALALGALAMVLGSAGCAAKVKQEDFNNEMAKLRQEMQAGDQAVASRVDSTSEALAKQTARIDALEQELQAFRQEYTVSIEKVRGLLKFTSRCTSSSPAASSARPTDRCSTASPRSWPSTTPVRW